MVFAYCTDSDPIEVGDLGSKVKVTVTQYQFFFFITLLNSPLYTSALLSLIKLKFGMLRRYALGRFVCEFHKKIKIVIAEVTGKGQRSNEITKWLYLVMYQTHRHHTWYKKVQFKKQHLMTTIFFTLTKVKCRGVCIF